MEKLKKPIQKLKVKKNLIISHGTKIKPIIKTKKNINKINPNKNHKTKGLN